MRRKALRSFAVAAGMVALGSVITGCGANISSSGNFTPAHAGVLTVATDDIPVPGLWVGTPLHPTGGFEYGLARAIAARMGLGRVQVVIVPFDQILTGDLLGADLALSDLTSTAERKKNLQFSGVYLSATPAVLCRAGQSVDDLNTAQGLHWAVQRNTTLSAFLENTVQPNLATTYTASSPETIQQVADGTTDAGLLDLPVAAAAARSSAGRLVVTSQFPTNDSLSAALAKTSSNLDAVDSAIHALIADGTVTQLAHRWLGLDLRGTSANDILAIPIIP
ncbi:MAG: transporter substrate-binding domain-containing protein [Acidimicrobiales bacterium]